MKPPRLPGTERFRFCDKKFEQSKKAVEPSVICEEQPDSVTSSKVTRKDSFLLQFQARSCSDESLLCSCGGDHSHTTADSITNSGTSSCVLEELISQTTNNLPGTRYEHNKRKPHLPISSRLTSRVFNLTNCLSHLNEENYFRDKGKDLYDAFIPRHHFPSDAPFDCSSSSRSSTPTSLDSTGESLGKLTDSKCRIHSVANLRLLSPSSSHAKLLINSTSHASLMSDESSTSSSHQTDCDESLRSCSCSPVEHWAKQAAVQNRLSSSSQSSWEDGSALHDVT